jgi:hypothetical protein
MGDCQQHGPNCERIHVGDVVRVVAKGLGFWQPGTVLAIHQDKDRIREDLISVHFPDGIPGLPGENELTYIEAELEKLSADPPVDPIAEYYRAKEAAQAKELDEHRAAGGSIHTFEPNNLID